MFSQKPTSEIQASRGAPETCFSNIKYHPYKPRSVGRPIPRAEIARRQQQANLDSARRNSILIDLLVKQRPGALVSPGSVCQKCSYKMVKGSRSKGNISTSSSKLVGKSMRGILAVNMDGFDCWFPSRGTKHDPIGSPKKLPLTKAVQKKLAFGTGKLSKRIPSNSGTASLHQSRRNSVELHDPMTRLRSSHNGFIVSELCTRSVYEDQR
ncbi:hypothetical protein C8J56DRAFT_1173624 [Mycena floridula]|nr:hypothetical protein C8J56DRAFT_1173624 [Mycena floridula]